jgi:plasmid maintenance system antidote protein VapI
MAATMKPARVPSPGRILLRELNARGWSQRDRTPIMGNPYQAIRQIARASSALHLRPHGSWPRLSERRQNCG